MTDNRDFVEPESATREELLAQWARLFGRPAPAKAGQRLMSRLIAYELQANTETFKTILQTYIVRSTPMTKAHLELL
jgi:hypothetical protein